VDGYRTGFIGASTKEATAWVAAHVGDAKSIFVPFAGTGKDVMSMSGPDRVIESWDTQYYSRAIIEGVFAASEPKSNVDKLHYRKGFMFETRAIKNIDERCAGFIDWVVEEGTLFDHAALGSAIVRCTLMGRMTQWYANMEQLFSRFQRARDYNLTWVGKPGTFVHHEGSVFDSIAADELQPSYDLMQVDPPKVVVGKDVYSANFDVLNKTFKGAVTQLPPWSTRDSMGRFRELMRVDAKRILFMYLTGVKPTYEEVKAMLLEHGELEAEEAFTHRGRTDYALIIRRK
jgi:hypothetical protein